MLKTIIKIDAVTTEELLLTLEEVKRQLEKGLTLDNNQRENLDASYSFTIEGSESAYIVCPDCNSHSYIINDKVPDLCWDCGEDIEGVEVTEDF